MNRKLKILIFVLVFFWYAGIFIKVFAKIDSSFLYALPFLQITYSNVCLQKPSELIHIGNVTTMVGARCTGIYTGFFISAILIFFISFQKKLDGKFLILALVPMAVDIISVKLGFYDYSKTIAFTTGIVLGSIGFYYFYEGISNYFNHNKSINH